MDRMASMAAFTKVVGAGSFSAAAREMQVSQALVTKQIQELESWLGARLLNRTTRRLSLTEVGTSFFERAARILEAVEEAKNAAGALQTVPRGRLRINAPVSFGLLNDGDRRWRRHLAADLHRRRRLARRPLGTPVA